jgi:Possible lysine decarboxylase
MPPWRIWDTGGELSLTGLMFKEPKETCVSQRSEQAALLERSSSAAQEMLEMVTWLQLGFHQKPVALLNISGFYEHLLGFFDHCVTEVSGDLRCGTLCSFAGGLEQDDGCGDVLAAGLRETVQ